MFDPFRLLVRFTVARRFSQPSGRPPFGVQADYENRCQSVQDADIEDPGPYEGVDSAPVDPGYWVDPTSWLGGLSGERGVYGARCDGDFAYEGTLESRHDAASTAGWNLTGG